MKKIGMFGLGEAGAIFAAELISRGVAVSAYDPAGVPTPGGVSRFEDPRQVVNGADCMFALTASQDAVTAMIQAIDAIPSGTLYADFSSASPGLKKHLATLAREKGFPFADIALMAIVPGNGLKAPALASGTGAAGFVDIMRPLGMPVEAISSEAGDAAACKLLRSVMMKGLAAVTIEALRAARAAGCLEWLWDNLTRQITDADAATLARLVTGSGRHAVRRLHEMEASVALLEELGVDPLMTRSTAESLRRIPKEGIPEIP